MPKVWIRRTIEISEEEPTGPGWVTIEGGQTFNNGVVRLPLACEKFDVERLPWVLIHVTGPIER